MDATELRDIASQYNKLPYLEFKKTNLNFDWDHYFATMNVKVPDSVIIGQPAFIQQFDRLVTNQKMPQIKAYLKWAIMNQTAALLTEESERIAFEFYGMTIRGQKQMKSPDKKAIDIINRSALAEALGRAFVEKAFSQEARAKVFKMVDDLIIAFETRIKQLVWMSEDTKTEAQRKLASFTRKLGFPEHWTDYSKLKINKKDYFGNVMNCRKFDFEKNIDRLYKPIDKTRWEMPPHIVNAYYNPLLNEIVFPAGILQPPFFDAKAEDAVNYARMGAVIGHELTHGFDDQGAQFTAEGLFKNWWNEDDFMQFQLRTAKLVNQYNAFQPVPGVFVNGKLTLGENIADFGGLTIAYHAYMHTLKGKKIEKVNGYTPEQRFFIAFAQIWKSNTTEKALRHQIDTDPHSPAKYRVNGSLANMPEFFAAFNIPKNKPMRLPDADIAIIW
jgi:putative endopeptidase